jgi:hypothetical protein
MTDLSPQTQAILNSFFDEWDVYAKDKAAYAIAASLRVLADELSYTIFLSGNDCRVIDASAVYKIADEVDCGDR